MLSSIVWLNESHIENKNQQFVRSEAFGFNKFRFTT